MNKSITCYAEDIIKNDFFNKDIIFIEEYLSHDGYDRYGPKSNILDLFIIEKIDNSYIFNNYHLEKWYTPQDDKEYYLLNKNNIQDCRLGDMKQMIENKNTNANAEFKSLLENMYLLKINK